MSHPAVSRPPPSKQFLFYSVCSLLQHAVGPCAWKDAVIISQFLER